MFSGYNYRIMLKRLAIVVLFAIVLPIYGCKESSKTSGGKGDSNSSQQPATAPTGTAKCVVKEEGSTIECRWPKDVPESKLRRLFSPENAPNIGLFFVGLGGIIAAGFTLLAVNKQADLMARQTKEMVRQNRNMVSKERARLHVELEKFVPEQIDVFGYPVKAKVSNIGATDAIIGKSELWVIMGDPDEFQIQPFMPRPIGLPAIVRSGDEPFEALTFLMRSDSLIAGVEGIPQVLAGEKFVYCIGKIRYTNLFDGKYEFRVNKRFRFYRYPSGEIEKEFGWWEDFGKPEDNGEYRQNPN